MNPSVSILMESDCKCYRFTHEHFAGAHTFHLELEFRIVGKTEVSRKKPLRAMARELTTNSTHIMVSMLYIKSVNTLNLNTTFASKVNFIDKQRTVIELVPWVLKIFMGLELRLPKVNDEGTGCTVRSPHFRKQELIFKPSHLTPITPSTTAQERTQEEFPKYFSHLRGFRLAKVGCTS